MKNIDAALDGNDLKADCARLAVKALSHRFDLMTATEIAEGAEDLSREIKDAIDWWMLWRYGQGVG